MQIIYIFAATHINGNCFNCRSLTLAHAKLIEYESSRGAQPVIESKQVITSR